MVGASQGGNLCRIGFIVEGGSEKVIVESPAFQELLHRGGYELVKPVIDAKGGDNLLPQNMEAFLQRFKHLAVDAIFVLTDQEDAKSQDEVRERIQHSDIRFIFVAVKALEAWYLADTQAMRNWLRDHDFFEFEPEATEGRPWDTLKFVAKARGRRGPGSKISFAKRMLRDWDFSLERAAEHPSCPSAAELVKYFSSPQT